jgi:hypothetical protein
VFVGQVVANPAALDALALQGDESATGSPITLGTQFTGFDAVQFYLDAAWTVDATAATLANRELGVGGFTVSDTLDITDLSPSNLQHSFNSTTKVLTLTEGSTTINLQFNSAFTGEQFVFSADTGAGTDITLAAAACYRRGTRIFTERVSRQPPRMQGASLLRECDRLVFMPASAACYLYPLGQPSDQPEVMRMSTISTTVTTPVILGGNSVGAYSSPLTIAAGGIVDPAGYTGAIGVYSNTASVTLTNDNEIYGGVSALGGIGGAAVDLTASATLGNYGRITGGRGYFLGSPGGSGGYGVEMNGGTLNDGGNISGGGGSYAGSGGVGVDMTGGTLTNGVNGDTADLRGGDASGTGDGGIGLVMQGGTVNNTSTGFIEGGYAHESGAGGVGAVLSNHATLTNHYIIDGGGSKTGDGAVGIEIEGDSTVKNYFHISGGNGDVSSSGVSAGAGATLAAGTTLKSYLGAGVYGGATLSGIAGDGIDVLGNATVTNAGEIDGGTSDFTVGGKGVSIVAGGALTTNYGRIYGGTSTDANGGIGVDATGTATALASVTTGPAGFYGEGEIFGGNSGTGPANGTGGVGVRLGAYASVSNSGKIYGGSSLGTSNTGGVGLLVNGSTEYNVNKAGGLIKGGDEAGSDGTAGTGVELASSGARLTNSGYIAGGDDAYEGHFHGTAGMGAVVDAGATLTNLNDIFGGGIPNGGTLNIGVYLNGGTVINEGILNGTESENPETDVISFGDSVQFGPTLGSTLVLAPNASTSGRYGTLGGDLAGFKVGDSIQVDNTTLAQLSKSGSPTAGTYTVGTPDDGSLQFGGAYSDVHFVFSQVGANVDITLAEGAACYLRGTHIRTARGERPIETLRIGDQVMTLSGAMRPIRWIGRRRYSKSMVSGNLEVLPVRIRAGALGDGVPRRDLWVSPEHSMWVEGLLIPARALMNDVSIVQEDAMEEVVYLHLEFEAHEVIWAEGALSESYADDQDRERFDNAAEYRTLYPDVVRESTRFCAPRIEEGAELEAVRQRLISRATLRGNAAVAARRSDVGRRTSVMSH